MSKEQQWFAVRSVFRHEATGDRAIFEEKIAIYLAEGLDEAIDLARKDANAYVAMNEGFVHVPHFGVYALGHGSVDLNGSEIWSHLSQGAADSEKFYEDRYGRFELRDHDDE